MENKILVAYFVQKGKEKESVSKSVADALAEILKSRGVEASLFAITPTEEYPSERENFELATRIEKEQRHRPELVGKYSGMKHVEKILLVTPNWWDDMPMAVYSFLDSYDFAEKKIVPVVVHGGDGGVEVTSNLRNFLHRVWVLPTIELLADALDSPEAKAAETKAVDELLADTVSAQK